MRTKLIAVTLAIVVAALALAGVAAASGGAGAGGGALLGVLPSWAKFSSTSYIEVAGSDVTFEVAKPFTPVIDPVVTMLVNPGEDLYPGQDLAEVQVYYRNDAPIMYGVAFMARPDMVLGEVGHQLDVRVLEFVDSTGFSERGMQAVGPGGEFKAHLLVRLPYWAAPTRFSGLYMGIVPIEPQGGKG